MPMTVGVAPALVPADIPAEMPAAIAVRVAVAVSVAAAMATTHHDQTGVGPQGRLNRESLGRAGHYDGRKGDKAAGQSNHLQSFQKVQR